MHLTLVLSQKALRLLSLSKNISSIELRTRQTDKQSISQDPDLVGCIKIAKDILRKVEGKKSLTVRHESYTLFTPLEWVEDIDVN
jgi:hypothetical protein